MLARTYVLILLIVEKDLSQVAELTGIVIATCIILNKVDFV